MFMMFVEAFSPVGWTPTSLLPIIPRRRTHNPLLVAITNNNEAVVLSSASSSSSIITSTRIEYNETSQHHILTIPPRIIDYNDDDDNRYPSPLHRIHIQPFLSDNETYELLELAREYATQNESWEKQDSSRHVSYPTVDFAIEESSQISQYMETIQFEQRIFSALSDAYGVDVEDMSFLDLFCASYEGKDNGNNVEAGATAAILDDEDSTRDTTDHLELHRDGSLLSFTILLSPTNEFEGGGTNFDALLDVAPPISGDVGYSILRPLGVIQPPAGFVVLHSGKLLHGGHTVTKGQRIVLVGFVDVHQRNMRPGALSDATKEWGRNDVRLYWNKRRICLLTQQQQKPERQDIVQPTWNLKNSMHMPKGRNSCIGPNVALPTNIIQNIENRAKSERIRRRRLITEDKLIREILLPRSERGDKIADDNEGIWTEVDMSLGWDMGNNK